MLGLEVDQEELQDFDLDVVHQASESLEVQQDSLMGLALKTKVINN